MNQSLGERWAFRPGVMLRHVIFAALCVPFYTESDSTYAPIFVLTNFFALLFLVGAVWNRRIAWKSWDAFGYTLTALLVLENVFAFYYNWKYHKWYVGQLHYSISFLTFILLCFFREEAKAEDRSLVRFLLGLILITNAAAIVMRCLGYWDVDFINNRLFMTKDKRYVGYPWIYYHKSEFSFALVLFLAVMAVYRNYFQRKWLFWAGIGILAVDLVLADTYTSMAAAVFIPVGILLDRIFAKKHVRLRYLLWLIPIAVAFLVLYTAIDSHRNISTLGLRIPIWKEALHVVKDYPAGFGTQAGMFGFGQIGYALNVPNCHNVFLNWMLQLSLPAGLCMTAMFFTIIVVSIKRNPSFTTLGIWVALLLPMTMDWCVLPMELTMTLLCIYLMFFSPLRKAPSAAGETT